MFGLNAGCDDDKSRLQIHIPNGKSLLFLHCPVFYPYVKLCNFFSNGAVFDEECDTHVNDTGSSDRTTVVYVRNVTRPGASSIAAPSPNTLPSLADSSDH